MEDKLDKQETEVTLQQIHDSINRYLYVEDPELINIILITIRSIKGQQPLWVMIIGESATGKSEVLSLFENKHTYTILKLTRHALVHGNKNKKDYPDLAEKLDRKVMMIPEWAEISSGTEKDQNAIISQFRNLHDGKAGGNYAGTEFKYTNLKVGFLGGSTQIIEQKVILGRALGTRELIYRTKRIENVSKLRERVIENMGKNVEDIRTKIRVIIERYIDILKYENKETSREEIEKIGEIATMIEDLRATAPTNYNTGEIIGEVNKEETSRITRQLTEIYNGYRTITEYEREKIFDIIFKIALDQIPRNRLKILMEIMTKPEGTTYTKTQMGEALNISKNTANIELMILTALGILNKNVIKLDPQREINKIEYYVNKENKTIKALKEYMFLPTEESLDTDGKGLNSKASYEEVRT